MEKENFYTFYMALIEIYLRILNICVVEVLFWLMIDYVTPQWQGQVYPSEEKGAALTNTVERLSVAVCCPYYASGLRLYSSDAENSDIFSSRILVYTEGQHASFVVFPYINCRSDYLKHVLYKTICLTCQVWGIALAGACKLLLH